MEEPSWPWRKIEGKFSRDMGRAGKQKMRKGYLGEKLLFFGKFQAIDLISNQLNPTFNFLIRGPIK